MLLNKVEICGVNTSRLKVISENRKIELIKIIRHGTPEEAEQAREEMINGNLKLVLSVIRKFSGRGENPDDLFQVGVIGLIKAIDNFDCEKDVRFSTYGVPMIIGEIRRYLRDNNSIKVSRSIKDTAYKVMQMKEKFISETGREPTVSEISKALSIPSDRVITALEASVEPSVRQLHAFLGVAVVAGSRRAFVEGHHDVGANHALCVDDVLRGEKMLRAVDV